MRCTPSRPSHDTESRTTNSKEPFLYQPFATDETLLISTVCHERNPSYINRVPRTKPFYKPCTTNETFLWTMYRVRNPSMNNVPLTKPFYESCTAVEPLVFHVPPTRDRSLMGCYQRMLVRLIGSSKPQRAMVYKRTSQIYASLNASIILIRAKNALQPTKPFLFGNQQFIYLFNLLPLHLQQYYI